MLTAAQIRDLACEAAHSPGKTHQAEQFLNSILSDLCQTRQLAAARNIFTFNFNPQLNPGGTLPAQQFGSGPYKLPVDYLRMSDSSGSEGAQTGFIWYLNGVPYPVIPVDLAEFDLQVQQAGLNSYPWLWATDMSSPVTSRIVLVTTGNVTIAGTTISGLLSTERLAAGLGVSGEGITPGTTVISVDAATATCVISAPGLFTRLAAPLMFGAYPVGYVYPPPSGNMQVMLRYQMLRVPIVDFENTYPWFTDTGYLLKKLTGAMCMLNDDTRAGILYGGPNVPGSPENELTAWLALKDDDSNRAKTVQLDRRSFGSQFRNLPTTKQVGW